MKQIITFTFLSFFGLTHAQIPSYVPSNGLVGWWPFNGNANDESGNGNNGTVNGATLTTDRNGLLNTAYSFDGVDDFISAERNFQTEFTTSLWFNYNGIQQYNPLIDAFDSNWELQIIDSYISFVNFVNPPSYQIFNATALQNGVEWKNIICKFSNNNLKIYLNGIEIFQANVNQLPVNSGNYFFGASLTGSDQFLNGSIDDIGIWNRALTDCEIQDLYHAQLGFTTINAGADQEVCHGTEVILNGTGGSNLTWNNGVVNGVSFVPTQTSNYLLTGSDSLGCFGVDTVMVMVNATTSSSQTQVALDTYTWPVNNQTYTQSGVYTDTLVNAAGCDSILTLNLSMEYTGLFDGKQLNAYISPNPVKDQFGLHGATNLTALNLLDVQGKLVQTFDVQQDEFSLSNLKPGIYFLELHQGNPCSVFKLMKE